MTVVHDAHQLVVVNNPFFFFCLVLLLFFSHRSGCATALHFDDDPFSQIIFQLLDKYHAAAGLAGRYQN